MPGVTLIICMSRLLRERTCGGVDSPPPPIKDLIKKKKKKTTTTTIGKREKKPNKENERGAVRGGEHVGSVHGRKKGGGWVNSGGGRKEGKKRKESKKENQNEKKRIRIRREEEENRTSGHAVVRPGEAQNKTELQVVGVFLPRFYSTLRGRAMAHGFRLVFERICMLCGLFGIVG